MIEIVESTTVSRVWAGHPVRFDLLTHGGHQFVAFYDAERRMTVAARTLGQRNWTYFYPPGKWLKRRRRLSTVLGWDSHNSLRMAIDAHDQIHLCGNMHVDPLIYFRTTRPLDITSLEAVNRMIGTEETRCTYPLFLEGPNGDLIFRYRAGRSGNGVDYYNVYDVETQRWRRLLDTPLLDGQGQMNAYARAPTVGPDGRYHMVWMWRDTPDCATNHDLGYACSPDLVHWQAGDGSALDLPITIESGATVDAAQPGEGLINMVQSLGFDSQQRPVLAYTRYDENGVSQAYCARLEQGRWRMVRISDWTYRWAFGGGGSIPADIRLGNVQVRADSGLSLSYRHIQEGAGSWRLDEDTLEPLETLAPPPEQLPVALASVESDVPGMQVRSMAGRGEGPNPELHYLLRWETLRSNRDRPHETAPPPSDMRVYTIRTRMP